MNQAGSTNKVISFPKRILVKKNMTPKKENGNNRPGPRIIAITSGKGGVGKTNIVANLGFAFGKLGKRVLILDADLGLGNLDVLLGLAPKFNLAHVIAGEKTIPEITIQGPGNMKILPASSGIQELTRLTKQQKIFMLTQFDALIDSIDFLLIDTAAGISSNVMYFNVAAQEIIVVVTPEPTSMTDAYALMKVLSLEYSENRFHMLVNRVKSAQEAYEVFRQLSLVADRFLDITINYIGHILLDNNVTKGVMLQKIVSEIYPDTRASMCIAAIAKKIVRSKPFQGSKADTRFFWKKLIRNGLEQLDD